MKEFIIAMLLLFAGTVDAKTLTSKDGYTTQVAPNPSTQMMPFYLNLGEWGYLLCQPFSPDGAYVCAFSDELPQ